MTAWRCSAWYLYGHIRCWYGCPPENFWKIRSAGTGVTVRYCTTVRLPVRCHQVTFCSIRLPFFNSRLHPFSLSSLIYFPVVLYIQLKAVQNPKRRPGGSPDCNYRAHCPWISLSTGAFSTLISRPEPLLCNVGYYFLFLLIYRRFRSGFSAPLLTVH